MKSLLDIEVKLKKCSRTGRLVHKKEATYTIPQHTKKSKMEAKKKRRENT